MNQDPNKTPYQLYLESEHWSMLREACFRRDGYRCVSCQGNFQITSHHLTYRNLHDCTVHDVMTLCWPCHGAIHDHMKINGIRSGQMGPLDVLAVLRRMKGRIVTPAVIRPALLETSVQGEVFPPEGDGPFVITRHMMRMLRTEAGGYTTATIQALGLVPPYVTGWVRGVEGKMISKESLDAAIAGRSKYTPKGLKRLKARTAKTTEAA